MKDVDLKNCDAPAAAAASIPPTYYAGDALAHAEHETVFRKQWIGFGRADVVPEPGSYITMDVAGQNILLLRDREGKLRAYANACRHRGARLADGAGSCKGLRCPFHSWFYGLDGRLISAPQMEAAEAFEKTGYGLIAYRVAERHGFVFAALTDQVCGLDDHLAGFADIHTPWPLDQLRSLRRLETEVNCNWKAFLEVFNEYYHLPFVHADSIDSLYATPEAPDPVDGAFATQFGATEGTGGLLEDDQDMALPAMPDLTGQALEGARYTWVFPNMTFAANSDGLWCYEAYPLGAGRCKVVQTACFHPETMRQPDFDEKSAAYLRRMDAALAEDVEALENQQRGLSCPDAKQGRFQPDLEPNVAAFARWYAGCWD